MVELNFKDERYLPFEGAGVMSKWRLELPDIDFKQFDYNTISDVVVHLRYISTEGGERLKTAAKASAIAFKKRFEEWGQQEGLFTIIDLKHDFPTEWYAFVKSAGNDFIFKLDKNRFPFFVGANDVKVNNAAIYNKGKTDGVDLKDAFETSTPKATKIGNNQDITLRLNGMKTESPFLIIQYSF